MKLENVVARVNPEEPDRDRVKRTVLETIAALGLEVARDGEVYNPAPAPAWSPPQQRNARWGGGRR